MARPRVHDEATAAELLDAAAQLLRTGGPSAVSVRGAAEAAGHSVRAVYALFGSRQALMDALAERGYRSLTDRVRSVPVTDDPATDLVAAGAIAFRDFAVSEPESFRLTFEQVSAEVLAQQPVARAAADTYVALRDRIRRVRDAGSIHPDRTDEACAFALHSLCQGLAASELSARTPPDGPGFWPMAADLDIAAVWWDALSGLVGSFATQPAVR